MKKSTPAKKPEGKTLGKKKLMRVQDSAFFGMLKDEKRSTEEIMDELRGGRYRDL